MMVNHYIQISNENILYKVIATSGISNIILETPYSGATGNNKYADFIDADYTAIMKGIRVGAEVWHVKFTGPADLAGVVRGTNYLRFRFWDGYEYGGWSAIKQVTI